MAQAGRSRYQKNPIAITGYGTGRRDGWEAAFNLPSGSMAGGTGPMAFVVHATIGGCYASVIHPDAMIEVCVGSTGFGPNYNTIQRVRFDNAYTGRNGFPYTLTQVFDTGSVHGTTWNISTDGDFVLFARLAQNGPNAVAGIFHLMDCVVHQYNLTQLAGDYVFGNVLVVGRGIPYGGRTVGNNRFNMTELLSFPRAAFSAAKTWFLNWSAQYQPRLQIYNSTLIAQFNPDNSILNPGGDLYQNANTDEWETHWEAVGRFDDTNPDRNCQFSGGGFAEFTTSVVGTTPEFRFMGLSNKHEQLSLAGRFRGCDFFAVDTSKLGNWERALLDPNIGLYNGGAIARSSLKAESFAFSRTGFASIEFMWTARLKAGPLGFLGGFDRELGVRGGYDRAHRMGVKIAGGGQDQLDYAATYRNRKVAYAGVQGVHFKAIRKSATQFFVYGWGPGNGTHQTFAENIQEVEAVQWDWNPDPDVDPFAIPSIGPVVYIHPGYEGLAVGGLTEISPAPESMYDVRELDPKLALETDFAYQPSWPKFTTGRRRFSLRWNGITALERDTIAAFVSIDTLRTFKWTRPGQAALALLPVSELRSRSLGGGLYTADLSVVELIHLAP